MAGKRSSISLLTLSIDRWYINGGNLKIEDGYIQFTNNSNVNLVLRQRFEQLPIGTYTISVITESGLETGTVYWEGTGSSELISISFGQMAVRIVGGIHCISFFTLAGKSPKFYATKLELSPHQTLARKEGNTRVLRDPLPDKALELHKCLRYFVNPCHFCSIGTAYNKGVWFSIPLSTPMRAIPTIGKLYLTTINHLSNQSVNRTADVSLIEVLSRVYQNELFIHATFKEWTPSTAWIMLTGTCSFSSEL